MHLSTLLLALLPLALAAPAPLNAAPRAISLQQMHAELQTGETCNLPTPGQNCAGAARKDVILSYVNSSKQAVKGPHEALAMYIAATKAAGGEIAHEYADYGFSGFIPEPVLALIKAHGEPLGLRAMENACASIPWCGEAPC
ncbi:hypothetical protein K505DRAFT_261407 [Melanomma pulvis-pyrius CBS 109.77]|uniref:Inhibitor I9 domain-containing protein n=1 Tax=Melanomma pulvis-pyrius CBS 109.77 TaxID=1314802 RepID=A0A6A6WPI1_9PLEO|nr:hypothetical protein K505DRAFT_261407 [Melanomma pulvis-pyrius CBS 109.77]